jgi:hypothetical protein
MLHLGYDGRGLSYPARSIGVHIRKMASGIFHRREQASTELLSNDAAAGILQTTLQNFLLVTSDPPGPGVDYRRQHRVHISSMLQIRDLMPTHLWDVEDRIFLSPEHRDPPHPVVPIVKMHVWHNHRYGAHAGDPLSIVVMIVVSRPELAPEVKMFLESDLEVESNKIFRDKHRMMSLTFEEVYDISPELKKLTSVVKIPETTSSAR